MSVIRLDKEFVPAVLDGRKVSTVRRGWRGYQPGDCILRTDVCDIPVRVQRVRHCTLGDLTEGDAHRDGFSGLDELTKTLLAFYPGILPQDALTVVEFSREVQT